MQASESKSDLQHTGLFLGAERTEQALFQLVESLIEPGALLLSLTGLAFWFGEDKPLQYVLLGVLVFSLAFPGKRLARAQLAAKTRAVVLGWLGLATVLILFGVATGTLDAFSEGVVVHWLWLAPVAQISGHLAFGLIAPVVARTACVPRQGVIVGYNQLGRRLADEIETHPLLGISLKGYFDDRAWHRLWIRDAMLLGNFSNVADYVRANRVDIIFLALPMASQPRILTLLDALRDTTVSVYFVPDIFVTDLIQARMDAIGRIPVVAVCDTPFSGLKGIIKRGSDVVLSVLILFLITPVLVIVGLLVKLTSPGPVIFKQRRYGLDGKEIIVYKFRSMTVCEDGPDVPQARRNDSRITPLGRILRRTSLDELPQFINVLQGRMSIVGPRPHAVAHNEIYRRLIKSYMIRHKVKPGITGWAQVNGCRGETETLEKMQARIDYDLDYLRHWSLRLDLKIIVRTILVIFGDAKAF